MNGQRRVERYRSANLAAPNKHLWTSGRILTRATANALLGRVGMRLMNIDGKMVVGLWSALDSSEVRAALTVFHPDGTPPIRYLDGADIPTRYKERRVPGEPVPLHVLHAMEQDPAEP